MQVNREKRRSYFEVMRGVACQFWRRRGKQSVSVKSWTHFSLQEREIKVKETGYEKEKRKRTRLFSTSVCNIGIKRGK